MKIREHFIDSDECLDYYIPFQGSALENFSSLSEIYLKKIVIKFPNKSCILDPVPIKDIKDCIDILVPILTKMVNLSISTMQYSTYFIQEGHCHSYLEKRKC